MEREGVSRRSVERDESHVPLILSTRLYDWRKVVPGKGITLVPAQSTLAIVYMRTNLTPFPKPTARAHFLIISS